MVVMMVQNDPRMDKTEVQHYMNFFTCACVYSLGTNVEQKHVVLALSNQS